MVEDRRQPHRTKTEATNFASKVQPALAQLATAYMYSRATGVDPWQFAVEMDRLMAAGMTTSQLRWLVLMGYVEHAREVTGPHDSCTDLRLDVASPSQRRPAF